MYVETARVKQFYQKTFFIHRYNDETNRLFSMLIRKISKCLKILYRVFEKTSIVWITLTCFDISYTLLFKTSFCEIKLYIIYITTNNNNKSYCYPYSFIWFLEHLEHTKLFLSFFYFLGVPEGDFKSFSNQLTSKVHPVTKPNALWNLSQFIGTLDQKNWRISFYPFKQLYFVT